MRSIVLPLALAWLPAAAFADKGDIQNHMPSPGDSASGLGWDGEHLWVANLLTATGPGTSRVTRHDPRTGDELGGFDMPPADVFHGLAFDESGGIWTDNFNKTSILDTDIVRIDQSGNTEVVYPAQGTIYGVAYDSNSGLLLQVDNHSVQDGGDELPAELYAVDPENGNPVFGPVELDIQSARGVAFDGAALWVASNRTDSVYRVHIDSGDILDQFVAPGQGGVEGVAFDGSCLWISDTRGDVIYRVDHGQEDLPACVPFSDPPPPDEGGGSDPDAGTMPDDPTGDPGGDEPAGCSTAGATGAVSPVLFAIFSLGFRRFAAVACVLAGAACSTGPAADAPEPDASPPAIADGAVPLQNPCAGGCSVTTLAGVYDRPTGVAVHAGAVYVADMRNQQIGVIGGGVATVLAGTGESDHRDGALSAAAFWNPRDVAVGSGGSIYVADASNHRIRRIDGDQVTTVAGSGPIGAVSGGFVDGPIDAARFWLPSGIAVASDGTIIVADAENDAVRFIADGTVTTVGVPGGRGYEDGPASSARFHHPTDVAIGSDGAVYVADWGNHRIRRIDPVDRSVTTAAGTGVVGIENLGGYRDGPALSAELAGPWGIAADASGRLYVADSRNHRIRVMLPRESGFDVETLAGSGDVGFDAGELLDGAHDQARFWLPRGIAVAEDGSIYVGDYANHRVRAILR